MLCVFFVCFVGVVQFLFVSVQFFFMDLLLVVGGLICVGMLIVNIVLFGYDMVGQMLLIWFNLMMLIVGEWFDFKLLCQGQGVVIVWIDLMLVVFQLINNDNGDEVFIVIVSVFGIVMLWMIVIDVDGNGFYDLVCDMVLVDGVMLVLLLGQMIMLFVILIVFDGGVVLDGLLMIVVWVVIGLGVIGIVYDGKGDGGGDVVVGLIGVIVIIVILICIMIVGLLLVKSQLVLVGDGIVNVVCDVVVIYMLEVCFVSVLFDVWIDDLILVGISYVVGSFMFDGVVLIDGVDIDLGQFVGLSGVGFSGGGVIVVMLVNVVVGLVYIIQFKMKI